MRCGIGVTAGQLVDGNLRRVHGHVKLAAPDAIRDERANSHLPVTRDELHPRSAFNAALRCELGRNLHEGVGRLLADSFGAVRQIAFVEMLEQAAVV